MSASPIRPNALCLIPVAMLTALPVAILLRQKLALTTCYPFGAIGHGPLRYVVHAVEVAAASRAR